MVISETPAESRCCFSVDSGGRFFGDDSDVGLLAITVVGYVSISHKRLVSAKRPYLATTAACLALNIMSVDFLTQIKEEVDALRSFFGQQEQRIQTIIEDALKANQTQGIPEEVPKGDDDSKLQELKEALDRSKASARAADGKIKLLQYQLAKAKAQKVTTETSALPSKKVTFEDEKDETASNVVGHNDWLSHLMRMKVVCRELSDAAPTETAIDNEMKIDLELEISRCEEMGNMLDELGVLSESFVTRRSVINDIVHDDSDAESNETVTTAEDTQQHIIKSETPNKVEEDALPKSFHEKVFSFMSPVQSLASSSNSSVATVTTKYDAETQSATTMVSQESQPEVVSIGAKGPASYCSLRMYMEKIQNKSSSIQNGASSPVSVMCGEDLLSPPPVTIGGESRKSSLISPTQMKQIFQGFQAAATPRTMDNSPSASTVSALTPATCHKQLHHSDIVSPIAMSCYSAASKKTTRSEAASSVKTFSRLIDCGSSFVTEHTEGDLSCHTLTTEFGLMHDFRSIDPLELPSLQKPPAVRYVVDVEQPLLNARFVRK